MRLSRDQYLILLLGACLLIFFSHLGTIYVNIMEARNFITAREMLDLDHWLLTTLNDTPRYQKPPLPTWLTALSGWLFGMDKLWALRLPAALSAVLLAIYFYLLAVRINLGRSQALRAGLILITSFYIIFSGRNGQWDIFAHAFMMGSVYFLYRFCESQERRFDFALLAGLFMGASFMSKGPVSLYALFLPFLLAYGLVYRFSGLRKKWPGILMLLIVGLAAGLWWFLYVRWADPIAFERITSKETSNWGSYNVRPFYYYWSFFTQSGVWTIPAFVALLYPYLKNKVSDIKAYRFALLWTVFSVVLLSLIPEKKARYLLPVLIPMALNTSFYIEYLIKEFAGLRLRERLVVYFNFGLIGLIGIAFPVAAIFVLELQGYYFWYTVTSIGLVSLGGGIVYYLWKRNLRQVFYSTILMICCIIALGFPLSNAFLDNPDLNAFSNLRQQAESSGLRVYEYQAFDPEIVWDYGMPIPVLVNDGKVELPVESRFGLLCSINGPFPEERFPGYRFERVGRYDLNPLHPDKSRYKDRLARDFYIVELKEQQ